MTTQNIRRINLLCRVFNSILQPRSKPRTEAMTSSNSSKTLKVLSKGTSSTLPVISRGEPITGTVELDVRKPNTINVGSGPYSLNYFGHGELGVRGMEGSHGTRCLRVSRRVYTFLFTNNYRLYDPKSQTQRYNEWPFSITLFKKIIVKNKAKSNDCKIKEYPLPPTCKFPLFSIPHHEVLR